MNKQQLILIILALATVAGLYFLGPTVAPGKKTPEQIIDTTHQHFSAENYLQTALSALNPERQQYINSLVTASKATEGHADPEPKLHAFHKLAAFWRDSVPNPLLHFYFAARAAELDNTEKSLTFAAHSILGYLPFAQNQEEQTWLAGRGKELFDKALVMNPANDSSVVGAGGCIIYGAGNGPEATMQGIMKIREVVEKDSTNLFAQYMLGIGGMVSRQYDKAALRFEKVVKGQPDNLEVLFKLAEVNELMKNNKQAIYWYGQIKNKVSDEGLKAEIEKRIEELKMP